MKIAFSSLLRGITAVVVISFLVCTSLSAQIIPGVKLVQKNEQTNQAAYTFKKGNKIVKLRLKRVGNQVNLRVLNQQGTVLGRVRITPDGNYGRNINVLQTSDKIFFLFVFGLNRTNNSGGTMALLPINSKYASDLEKCIAGCQKGDLKQVVQIDQREGLVKAVNSSGIVSETGGCDEITICTADALNEYDQCVEACKKKFGSELNDKN